MSKLIMVVSGQRRGKKYDLPVTFTLIPPKGMNYFGNGFTMNVEIDDYSTPSIHYVDVSYSGTIDLEKLARIWVKDYFGNTVTNIKVVESTQRGVLASAKR